MTLKIDQYLVNIIHKEFAISHVKCKVWAGKKDKIKADVKAQIKAEYGDSFLEDADYCLFFRGDVLNDSSGLKSVFKAVNQALGKSANSLSESDFKAINKKVESKTEDGAEDESSLNYVFVKITLN